MAKGFFLIAALMIALQHPQTFVCNAEDVGDDNFDDFYSVDDDDYYTLAPTSKPPTIAPTAPTLSPTNEPSAQPSARPSRARIDFYEVNIDDYTVEAQFAETYISSISDVILCLLCTFFWILWLVGTIFPTKIQHLYKSEGVVVRGDVLEAYVSHSQGSPAAPDTVPGEDSGSEMNAVTTGGDTFDALNDLPTYHAIVSYVVPGSVAQGRRRIRRIGERLSPSNNYHLQTEVDNARMLQQTIHGTVADHALEELSSKLSVDHVKASMALKGTPPRPPRTMSSKVPSKKVVSSPDSTDSFQFEMRNRKLSRISEDGVRKTNEKSLIDTSDSRSQDDASTKPISELKPQNEKMGFYKYNKYDTSDYGPSSGEGLEAEYENPEMIGNLFHSLGLSGLVMNKDKPLEQKPSPVRVKKRFETHELLKRGSKCIEIIVLPGNPGSGILKDEFEQEEDYMLTGTVSQDEEKNIENEGHSSQMGDVTAGIIGVILSAVSVIGAVHGALTLPYQKRICKLLTSSMIIISQRFVI